MTEIQTTAVIAACALSFLLGAGAAFLTTDSGPIAPVVLGSAVAVCALVVSVARLLFVAV